MPDQEMLLSIMRAQELNQEPLLEMPNIIGVATGFRQQQGRITDELCVQVFVVRKLPLEEIPEDERVPELLTNQGGEAVGTDVIEISLPEAQQDTTRYRPVNGGCSIGPEDRNSAGTLGGWATDLTDGAFVLLSNNHVISSLDTQPAARRIVQPGRLDGGTVADDVIGSLKRDVPLTTMANPPPAGAPDPPVTAVDAAIGTIEVDRTDDVLDIGPGIYEIQGPTLGMDVQKRGRTTRLTRNGQILSVNGTFLVTYNNQTRRGNIANSFVIRSTDGNPFSRPGDSGSLTFNQQQGQLVNTRPVCGLLYAGGTFTDGTPYSLACDINAVFNALNLGAAGRFRLVQVSGYSVGNEDRYAAIWEQREGPAWEARHGLTAAAYQQTFDSLVG